jgi:hypothetical protein
MNVITVDIDKLNPAPYNPRKDLKPGDAEYEKLATSIEAFGYLEPIVYNQRTGNVISGHQRLKVLKAKGEKRVEVVVVDFDEDTEKAANLALNKISGDWDFTKLADLLLELDTANFDLDLTGFDHDELEQIMGWTPPTVGEAEFDPDEAVENAPTRVQPGEVWQLGKHRVMCGDSTKADDVERLMAGERAACAFSDPPYNVDYEYADTKDDRTPQEYTDFNRAWFGLLCSNSERQVITPGGNNLALWLADVQRPYHTAVWTKTNALTRGKVAHCMCWEPILFYGEQWPRERANDVFDFPVGLQPDVGGHTCPKPLKLLVDIVSNYVPDGACVLDLFLGSGTTLIAAEQTGRVCYGMEISPRYCDVILARWEKLTGQQAARVDATELVTC